MSGNTTLDIPLICCHPRAKRLCTRAVSCSSAGGSQLHQLSVADMLVIMAAADSRRSKSPAKSGALSPYLPNPGSPGKGSPKAKGAHMGTIKSLGLIHDLQEYISNVEAVTVEQRHELDRLKEEKKEMEKTVLQLEVQGDRGMGGPLNEFFRASELTELPPKLRAVFEENKIMKEKLRKYKSRVQSLEQQVSTRNNQLVCLEDSNALLRQQLEACSRTPAEVDREEALKGEVYVKERQVANLEHAVSVLKSKLETDAKLHRQALHTARKEQEGLKKQIVLAHAQLEEQDKELRAARLEIRRLNKSLAPSRGSPTKSMALGEDLTGFSGAASPRPADLIQSVTELSPSGHVQPRPNSPPAVHLMLCVLHDGDTSSSPAPVPASNPAQMPFGTPAGIPPMSLLSPPPLQFGMSGRLSAPVGAFDQAPPSPLLHRPLDTQSPLARLSAAFKSIKVISPPIPQQDDADLEGEPEAAQQLQEALPAPSEDPMEAKTEDGSSIQQASDEQAQPQEQGDTQQQTDAPQGDGEAAVASDQASDSQEPQETHASAPRAVPYRHTAARATGQKGQAEPKGLGKAPLQAGGNPRSTHITLKPAATKPGAQPSPPAAGAAGQPAKRGTGATNGGKGSTATGARTSRTGGKDPKSAGEKRADKQEEATPRPWSSSPADGAPEQQAGEGPVEQQVDVPAADAADAADGVTAAEAVTEPAADATQPEASLSGGEAAPEPAVSGAAGGEATSEQASGSTPDAPAAAVDGTVAPVEEAAPVTAEQPAGAVEQVAEAGNSVEGASRETDSSTPPAADVPDVATTASEGQGQPAAADAAATSPEGGEQATGGDAPAAETEPSAAEAADATAAVDEQPAAEAVEQPPQPQQQQEEAQQPQADAVSAAEPVAADTPAAGPAADVEDPAAAAAAEAAAKLTAESSGWPSLDEEQSEPEPKSEPTATTVGAETTATSNDGSSRGEASTSGADA